MKIKYIDIIIEPGHIYSSVLKDVIVKYPKTKYGKNDIVEFVSKKDNCKLGFMKLDEKTYKPLLCLIEWSESVDKELIEINRFASNIQVRWWEPDNKGIRETQSPNYIKTIKRTTVGCPVQYEGTLTDGRKFYFRYRTNFVEV